MADDKGARLVASALGSVVAESITLPTDVVKVRLQVQSSLAPRYKGFADCFLTTAREEGPTALWKGFTAALVRQVCYTSMSFVIYEPIRNMIAGKGTEVSYAHRLLAGGTAGSIAISVFNPAEVVKTQVQTHQAGVLPMREVIRRVYATDGVLGFWAGLKPNVARTFLVNAAELGTYDQAKTMIRPYFGEGFATHVLSSGAAGFCSACVSTPADVVKTRLMNSAGQEKAYTGMLNAGYTILKDEGPAALYKGFWPICTRKLIWCASFFVCYENIREAVNRRAM